MKSGYVLDWYTGKYFYLEWLDDAFFERAKWWEMLTYELKSIDKVSMSLWIYLWYEIKADRWVLFKWFLEWSEKDYFDKQQEFALEKYKIFKTSFKKEFKLSSTVTARYNIFSNQLYFYFYSEDRYVFSEYVKWLREQVSCNIFLFQVWARDMVRFSHVSKEYLTFDGRPLHASGTYPLPTIAMENISLQWLDWRDVERLKWRSWKLKESLSYESDLYLEESQKYPPRWKVVSVKWSPVVWTCYSFNVITWDVSLRTEKWEMYKFHISQIKFDK